MYPKMFAVFFSNLKDIKYEAIFENQNQRILVYFANNLRESNIAIKTHGHYFSIGSYSIVFICRS